MSVFASSHSCDQPRYVGERNAHDLDLLVVLRRSLRPARARSRGRGERVSSVKPAEVKNVASSTHSPPCKPVSSASSRRAASSGDSSCVARTRPAARAGSRRPEPRCWRTRVSRLVAIDGDDRGDRRMDDDVAPVAPLDAEASVPSYSVIGKILTDAPRRDRHTTRARARRTPPRVDDRLDIVVRAGPAAAAALGVRPRRRSVVRAHARAGSSGSPS